MENISIVVDGVISRSTTGNIHGGIALKIDGFIFPDQNWTDFVVVVMGRWCEAALALISCESSIAEVRFMEGPFLMEFEVVDSTRWNVNLVERSLVRRSVFQGTFEMMMLLSELLEVSEYLLDFCLKKQWLSKDLDELYRVSEKLKNAIDARI